MDGTLHLVSFYEFTTLGGSLEDPPKSTIWLDFMDHDLLHMYDLKKFDKD